MQIAPASALLDISRNYIDHRSRREDSWYWYSDEGKGGAIPFAVSTLYRGQNTRYTPMLSSITRGLQSSDIVKIFDSSISDQAKLVLRLAQSWWFGRELTRHPISHHAASQNLDLNEIALAQHYGIPTGYLDLTDDFNVGAFFATCRESPDGWQPVDSGVGVIYRVSLRKIENPFDDYIPLGPQKLPRPSEQCAWVVELPFCHGFEGWPGVEMLPFHHDHRVGQHFLEMFEGGKRLFPPDPLADVAEEILACGEIPVDFVEAALKSFTNDPCGILPNDLPTVRKEISTLISQIGYRQLLTDQHVAPLLADQEWVEKMLGIVKARAIAVRRVRIPQDETESKRDIAS
ncbi:hypothetical protein BLA18112_01527 [Burkholderia lata]|uniref:FRG domain-containing protein n=1 Tax=Burkholderia lata (strain ATCC 17760 / DSM 23089 / LMG 22485 / NCIMB 9086 / R18194 / 383) TaxID=482957 RepID=A0A6P2U9V3_BURL3|nr:FRG domain-containing protein [Burkholderia lata]VWC65700.1 hypothetical protein BLA18112_01527 [Burkholderia lata]